MTTRLTIKNEQAKAVIRVWHEAKNDYRVHIEGVGEHSMFAQLEQAIEGAAWLASLDGPDFGYEILVTLDANMKEAA